MMRRDDIFEQIHTYLMELFEIPEEKITMEARLRDDLDLDSIDAVDLMLKVQELAKVRLDPEQFRSVRTVGDVVERVHELFAKRV